MPFQLHGEHTVLQPFRRIELMSHIAISVLPGFHLNLSKVKHLRVKCLAQGHNIERMSQNLEGRNHWAFSIALVYVHLQCTCTRVHCRCTHTNAILKAQWEKHYVSLKILHQAGFETARQTATSAERHHVQTIAPCPSLWRYRILCLEGSVISFISPFS